MTESLKFPLPVFRFTGKESPLWYAAKRMLGLTGVDVSPVVLLKTDPTQLGLAKWTFKWALISSYFVWQIFVHKGYLYHAPITGTHRLQLQHPVENSCNPLDRGCNSNFRNFEELPYCKQHNGNVNESQVGMQETCEYFDEFDLDEVATSGADSLLISTRHTTYKQEVLCSGQDNFCPKKYEVLRENVVYVADVESFTLLIDHSIVSPELQLDHKAWQMVGMLEHCVSDKIRWKSLPGANTWQKSLPGAPTRTCSLQPIPKQGKSFAEMETDETQAFAMWLDDSWCRSFFPFFRSDVQHIKAATRSPFYKISNGDVIKIGDLLKETGVDLDEIDHGESKRSTGLVVAIDIEYTNHKSFTWPNRLPPIYKYSISLSPASEYKMMETRKRIFSPSNTTGERWIKDYHGIFVIVRTKGHLGCFSWSYVFLMFLGMVTIECVMRWLVAMFALNGLSDIDKSEKFEKEFVKEVHVTTASYESLPQVTASEALSELTARGG